MAKVSKYFTVTKSLPGGARIEFSGIVYNNDPGKYDIEDVRFHTKDSLKNEVSDDITQWFHQFRAHTDPQFHDNDIQELLHEWLGSDEAKLIAHPQRHAA